LKTVAMESETRTEERTIDPLRDEDAADLIKALFADAYERRLERGALLCRYGDVARHMWLLTHGEVDVIVPGLPVQTVVGRPDRPCLLGELGYFTGLRRAATLAASTPVRLLELPYERVAAREQKEPAFAAWLDRFYRVRILVPVLSRHEVFKRMNEVDRKKLVALFERVEARPGQILFSEGEEHPYAYFVQRGTLLLLGRDARGRETLLGGAHAGDIVHLGGLLQGFRPKYHVMASTPCKLLRLAQARFTPFVEKRPWLVKAILRFSRQIRAGEALHPTGANIWEADRYIELKKPIG
ncbi:MAG: cyclic nucleotide-binding domain-containing protein, partial [Zetaproteobacteria bacterium]